MNTIVVTGVSTGIGHAAVKLLLDKGFRVFGSVRKQEDADRLSAEFGDAFTPLIFDVTDETAIKDAADCVRADLQGETLAGLVNNAGIAVPGPLTELATDEFRQQLEVNLVGPFMVTKAFAPLLGTDPSLSGEPGRVVNISSVAGIRAMPFLGSYAASKFGLEGYSEALRRELLLYGIEVVVVGPGPVKTAIWDKAEGLDVSNYAGSPYAQILEKFSHMFIAQGQDGYPAERLGAVIHEALTTPRPKVRYAAEKGRVLEKVVRAVAGKRTLDKIIGKALGLLPALRDR